MTDEVVTTTNERHEKWWGITLTTCLVVCAIIVGWSKDVFANGINRNTVYYVIMLAIVGASKGFKTHQLAKTDKTVTWRNYGQLALDFANAAAGVVTLIISADRDSAVAIVAAYLFLYVLATNYDARAGAFGKSTAFFANIIVSAVIVGGIVYFCQTLLGPLKPAPVRYLVAVPYTDTSFRQWYSGSLGKRSLTYYTEVTAIGGDDARRQARQHFWQDSSLQPLHPKMAKDRNNLIIDVDRMVAEVMPPEIRQAPEHTRSADNNSNVP